MLAHLVLREVVLDELRERPASTLRGPWAASGDREGGVECRPGFPLRRKPSDLATVAVFVAVAVGPGAAAELLDLPVLNARHVLLLLRGRVRL